MVIQSEKIEDMLSFLRLSIPPVFDKMTETCTQSIERLESALLLIEQKTRSKFIEEVEKSASSKESCTKFGQKQSKALKMIKDGARKKIKEINRTTLRKINEEREKSQKVINSVIEMQSNIQAKVACGIEEFIHNSTVMLLFCHKLVVPLFKKYSKMKKDVQRLLNTLPKKMELIFDKLQEEVAAIKTQFERHCDLINQLYIKMLIPKFRTVKC